VQLGRRPQLALVELLFGRVHLASQHWQAEVSYFERETTVNNTIGAVQVAMEFYLTTVQKYHSFDYIVNEMMLEVNFQLDLLIL
jgi:hypothetical protein